MDNMDSLKILIVEDELITAMDLQETLEEAGHRVTGIARNYQEALKSLDRQLPDLTLIDIKLDGSTGDGITTARELVKQHRMPIIYLTANSEPRMFQSARETMPAAYLLKPFRHDELRLQIELAYHNFQLKPANGAEAPASVYWPVREGYEKVALDDVLYLEANGAYTKAYLTKKKEPYQISTNLSQLAQYFLTPNFYRLSRSLLINLDHLERLEQNYLYLSNYKPPIQIPASGRKELIKKLTVVRTK